MSILAQPSPCDNYNFPNTPLYFVRSGTIYVDSGYLKYAGNAGAIRSSVASSIYWVGSNTPSVYDFTFNSISVSTSSGPGARWTTSPLRCQFIPKITPPRPLHHSLPNLLPDSLPTIIHRNQKDKYSLHFHQISSHPTTTHQAKKTGQKQTDHTKIPSNQKPNACVKNFDTLSTIVILYQPHFAITPRHRQT